MATSTRRRARKGKGAAAEDSKPFKAAVEAAAEDSAPKTEVELGNGIQLNLRAVPPLLIRKAVGKISEPVIPVADIGKDRQEENPDDPEYKKAMEEYGQQTFDAGANVMLAVGTSLKYVPKGWDKPEDSDWVEALQAANFEPDVSTKRSRYLSWLSYYAITSEQDVVRIVMAVTALSGVPESEVASAVESFRGGETRGEDNGVSSEDA